MKIEWDETKRDATLRDRGLDFADVATIDWSTAVTVEDTRGDYAEVRFVTMAPIHGRLCIIAWCERDDAFRVISLRKANKREQAIYDQA